MTSHPFTDPISGRTVTLVLGGPDSTAYDGSTGVEHPDCDALADVSPDLDAWYCRACSTSGRISGAWFMAAWVLR